MLITTGEKEDDSNGGGLFAIIYNFRNLRTELIGGRAPRVLCDQLDRCDTIAASRRGAWNGNQRLFL